MGRGTFGVVLAVGEEVVWECAGPTDGDDSLAKTHFYFLLSTLPIQDNCSNLDR